MKKIFMLMMTLMMSLGVANAQIATENAKLFDNMYVTVGAGVAKPLGELTPVFPVNPSATLAVGKWFTPVFGAEIEGTAWFGSVGMKDGNLNFEWDGDMYNFVRGSYVGINGMTNLTNLFLGYNGKPRTFEVSTQLGLGWCHRYMISGKTENGYSIDTDKDRNGIGVKTGLDFAFNLGSKKAHTLSVRPAVLWEVANHWNRVQFNKNKAQLYLGVAYTYHFKTSNGTHYFKTYDVGAMNDEINRLRAELDAKPKEVVNEVVKEVRIYNNVNVTDTYVFFAFDSDELSAEAKESLDKLGQNGVYTVDAYASSEGTTEYNLELSQRRANAVKAYLESRGAKVDYATGHGVAFGTTTGRVAVVRVK